MIAGINSNINIYKRDFRPKYGLIYISVLIMRRAISILSATGKYRFSGRIDSFLFRAGLQNLHINSEKSWRI